MIRTASQAPSQEEGRPQPPKHDFGGENPYVQRVTNESLSRLGQQWFGLLCWRHLGRRERVRRAAPALRSVRHHHGDELAERALRLLRAASRTIFKSPAVDPLELPYQCRWLSTSTRCTAPSQRTIHGDEPEVEAGHAVEDALGHDQLRLLEFGGSGHGHGNGNLFTFASSQRGLGVLGCHEWRRRGEASNTGSASSTGTGLGSGDASFDNNSFKDLYWRAAYKFGGVTVVLNNDPES